MGVVAPGENKINNKFTSVTIYRLNDLAVSHKTLRYIPCVKAPLTINLTKYPVS